MAAEQRFRSIYTEQRGMQKRHPFQMACWTTQTALHKVDAKD